MNQFSTQYMPSHAGLIHAVPLMQRALKTGAGAITLLYAALGFTAFFIAGFANRYAARTWEDYPSGIAYVGAFGLFFLIAWGIINPLMRRRAARRFDSLLPPTLTRLAADESGVTVSNEGSHSYADWRYIRGAIETPGGIAILMGYSGIFVPDSAFRDTAERAEVVALINSRANRTAV
jgi:hypothetical protein